MCCHARVAICETHIVIMCRFTDVTPYSCDHVRIFPYGMLGCPYNTFNVVSRSAPCRLGSIAATRLPQTEDRKDRSELQHAAVRARLGAPWDRAYIWTWCLQTAMVSPVYGRLEFESIRVLNDQFTLFMDARQPRRPLSNGKQSSPVEQQAYSGCMHADDPLWRDLHNCHSLRMTAVSWQRVVTALSPLRFLVFCKSTNVSYCIAIYKKQTGSRNDPAKS